MTTPYNGDKEVTTPIKENANERKNKNRVAHTLRNEHGVSSGSTTNGNQQKRTDITDFKRAPEEERAGGRSREEMRE